MSTSSPPGSEHDVLDASFGADFKDIFVQAESTAKAATVKAGAPDEKVVLVADGNDPVGVGKTRTPSSSTAATGSAITAAVNNKTPAPPVATTTTAAVARSVYGDLFSPTRNKETPGGAVADEMVAKISGTKAAAPARSSPSDQQMLSPESDGARFLDPKSSPEQNSTKPRGSPSSPPGSPGFSDVGKDSHEVKINSDSRPPAPHEQQSSGVVVQPYRSTASPPSPKSASLADNGKISVTLENLVRMSPPIGGGKHTGSAAGATTSSSSRGNYATPVAAPGLVQPQSSSGATTTSAMILPPPTPNHKANAASASTLALPPPTPSPSAKRKHKRRRNRNGEPITESSSPLSSSMSFSNTSGSYLNRSLSGSRHNVLKSGASTSAEPPLSMFQRAQQERDRLRKLAEIKEGGEQIFLNYDIINNSGAAAPATMAQKLKPPDLPASSGSSTFFVPPVTGTTNDSVENKHTTVEPVIEHFQMASDDEDEGQLADPIVPSNYTSEQRTRVSKIRQLFDQKSSSKESGPAGPATAGNGMNSKKAESKKSSAKEETAAQQDVMVTPRSNASSVHSTPRVLHRGRVLSGAASPTTPTTAAMRDFQKFREEELARLAHAGKLLAEFKRDEDEDTEDGLSDVFDEELDTELADLQNKYNKNGTTPNVSNPDHAVVSTGPIQMNRVKQQEPPSRDVQKRHGKTSNVDDNTSSNYGIGAANRGRGTDVVPSSPSCSSPDSFASGGPGDKPRRGSFNPQEAFGTLESVQQTSRVPRFGQDSSPDTSTLHSPQDHQDTSSMLTGSSHRDSRASPPSVDKLHAKKSSVLDGQSPIAAFDSAVVVDPAGRVSPEKPVRLVEGPVTTASAAGTTSSSAKSMNDFTPPPRPPGGGGVAAATTSSSNGVFTPKVGNAVVEGGPRRFFDDKEGNKRPAAAGRESAGSTPSSSSTGPSAALHQHAGVPANVGLPPNPRRTGPQEQQHLGVGVLSPPAQGGSSYMYSGFGGSGPSGITPAPNGTAPQEAGAPPGGGSTSGVLLGHQNQSTTTFGGGQPAAGGAGATMQQPPGSYQQHGQHGQQHDSTVNSGYQQTSHQQHENQKHPGGGNMSYNMPPQQLQQHGGSSSSSAAGSARPGSGAAYENATYTRGSNVNTHQSGGPAADNSDSALPAHPSANWAAQGQDYFAAVVQKNRRQSGGGTNSADQPLLADVPDQQQHGGGHTVHQSYPSQPEWKGWTVTHDNQGAMFFHHPERGESVWEQPDELEDVLGRWELVSPTGEILQHQAQTVAASSSSTTPGNTSTSTSQDPQSFWRNEKLGLSLWQDPRQTATVFNAALEGNIAYLQLYCHFCRDALDLVDLTYQRAALHFAVAGGYNQAVELLVFSHANVNVRDGEGATPLHYACRYGYSPCVQSLLDAGADWNAVKPAGALPSVLHEACGLGQVDAVACLIYFSCDTSLAHLVNEDGLTPMQVASRLGYHEIVRLLSHNLDGALSEELAESSSDEEEANFQIEEDLSGVGEDDDRPLAGPKGEYRPLTSTLTSLMRSVHKTVSQLYPEESHLPNNDGKQLKYDPQRKEWVMIS
ncbi:unnamed protein product [Amoebophrya sp. A120]|nr:unnamed protein product [Amoebophrya sp. A120]|eukprot:GSA120T00000148001.1